MKASKITFLITMVICIAVQLDYLKYDITIFSSWYQIC